MAGHEVIWAGNHNETAIAVHQLNHPTTRHVCEDMTGFNYFDEVPDHDCLMSSPACQGHSPASQPRRRRYHEENRGVAWATIQCLDAKRPELVIVENVPYFKHQWDLYEPWLNCIKKAGYHVEEHMLNAMNHGVPQTRNRLFIVGRLGAKPNLTFEAGPLSDAPPISDILEDTDEGWTDTSEACAGDRVRLKAGREKCGSTFLLQQTTNHRGIPLHEPIRTITTKDHWKLVEGDRMRRLTITELKRAMGFPSDYLIPNIGRGKTIEGLGNAVCPPVMRDIVAQALG